MKKLRLIGIYMVLPALLVCCLGYVTLKRDKPNGFVRNFKDGYVQKMAETKYLFNLYDICGSNKSSVYFRTNDPNWVYVYQIDLKVQKIINLHIEEDFKVKQFFKTVIDSPNYSVYAGNVPKIFKGKLSSEETPVAWMPEHTLFNDIIEYRSNHFIVRRFEESRRDFIFQKMDSTGRVFSEEQNLSIKTPRVGIESQGTLLYDGVDKVYYVYRLFNKIVCFDTSLNHVFTVLTVDTITTPGLKTTDIAKKTVKFRTYSSPPRYTNYRASIDNGLLYVHSLIKSDNEIHNSNVPTMDVYSATNGKYQFSFHLADFGKLSELTVINDRLIAVYKSQRKIVSYKLAN